MQVETSADVGYNVATGIDVAVYNTIATVCWLSAVNASDQLGLP